ncbi:hypothetical protein AcW1_006132 [Taiwanofungus camphoratus]|nr:hypothetical protein AcW1_006132 [Antrodia cinnamomea]
MIAGNHDLCLDDAWAEEGELGRLGGQGIPSKDVTAAKELVRSPAVLQAGIHYLEHEFVQVTTPGGRTWNVYGSPAAPRYALGSFQYTPGDGDEIYAQIPVSTEILLTHTPPYEICDRTRRGKAAGCTELANRLESGELCHCRLHVFGHIHEAHGVVLSDGSDKCPGQRVSVNAAVASVGQAVIVDLQN